MAERPDLVAPNMRQRRTWYRFGVWPWEQDVAERVDYIDGGVTAPSDLPSLADNDNSFPGDSSLFLRYVDVSMIGGEQGLRVSRYESVGTSQFVTHVQIESQPKSMTIQAFTKPDGTLNTAVKDPSAPSPEVPTPYPLPRKIVEIRIPFRLSSIDPFAHVEDAAQKTNDANYEITSRGGNSKVWGPNELLMLWPELEPIGQTTTQTTGWWRVVGRPDGWIRERLTKGGTSATASDVVVEDVFTRTPFPNLPLTD